MRQTGGSPPTVAQYIIEKLQKWDSSDAQVLAPRIDSMRMAAPAILFGWLELKRKSTRKVMDVFDFLAHAVQPLCRKLYEFVAELSQAADRLAPLLPSFS